MLIDFSIRMKCGLITEDKTFFFTHIFFLHIDAELLTLLLVIGLYGLNEMQLVGCHSQAFSCDSSYSHWRNQGFQTCYSYGLPRASQKIFSEPDHQFFRYWCLFKTFSLAQTAFLFELFISCLNLHYSWCSFNEFSHRCTLLFDCIRKYVNIIFLFQWIVFLYLKNKTLNIQIRVVSTYAVKIWDPLNENWSSN